MSRRERIQAKLESALSPLHLEVIDESHMHSVPEGAESHFKVIVVSEHFAQHKLLGRHRMVNRELSGEFETGLHAIALHTWTPEEWLEKGGSAPTSPLCQGGGKAKNSDPS
jgi:BolA protein